MKLNFLYQNLDKLYRYYATLADDDARDTAHKNLDKFWADLKTTLDNIGVVDPDLAKLTLRDCQSYTESYSFVYSVDTSEYFSQDYLSLALACLMLSIELTLVTIIKSVFQSTSLTVDYHLNGGCAVRTNSEIGELVFILDIDTLVSVGLTRDTILRTITEFNIYHLVHNSFDSRTINDDCIAL